MSVSPDLEFFIVNVWCSQSNVISMTSSCCHRSRPVSVLASLPQNLLVPNFQQNDSLSLFCLDLRGLAVTPAHSQLVFQGLTSCIFSLQLWQPFFIPGSPSTDKPWSSSPCSSIVALRPSDDSSIRSWHSAGSKRTLAVPSSAAIVVSRAGEVVNAISAASPGACSYGGRCVTYNGYQRRVVSSTFQSTASTAQSTRNVCKTQAACPVTPSLHSEDLHLPTSAEFSTVCFSDPLQLSVKYTNPRRARHRRFRTGPTARLYCL